MATGGQHSPLKSKKISSSSSQARNDSDTQWLLIPNNLELSASAKPSKKQRNKEKHRHFRKENLSSSSEVADGLPCKTRSSFHGFPLVKSNTATWLKDQYVNDEKSRHGAYDSEEVFSDSDFPQLHQQNVHFPANQTFPDIEHQGHQSPTSWCSVENENTKSVKDELKKKETAMVCEVLSHIQDFISEAESSWQKLDLSDEPVIKDAFVKLKNAVKDVEGGRENKLMHHMAAENGLANGVSPSSSTSRVSNSKEIVNRDSSGNAILCNDDNEQDKCNQLFEAKASVMCEKADSLSSDDCDMADFGERVAAVEYERKKLKNKLVELQEEKKIKDELLKELYYLKDAANTASKVAQLKKSKEKKKKPGKLESPSQHVKLTKGLPTQDNQNVTLDSDISASQSASRHSRPSTSVKRDNVRKEQNASFPARRHYEAEGRANEDPDIPTASAPVVLPAADNPEIKEKIRKLKVAQEHVKVIKDIVVSILETRKSRAPSDQLRLLTPMQKVDPYFSYESEDSEEELSSGMRISYSEPTATNVKEISPGMHISYSEPTATNVKEISPGMHISYAEPTATNVKEIYCDGLKQSSVDVDSHKPDEIEVALENLETSVIKKEDLTKLQSQFHQLMQIFPSPDRVNDDPVRSSGEGAYSQKKNPPKNVPENVQKIHSVRTVPHQDNLQLTRQNIVSMESQNQNSNSNLHNRDCNSVKKDNINNLSGKMGKLSIQNSMNSSYPDVLAASNNNVDTMSTFSYELNQNHSLPNEVERKTILDILKRDKKKQKQYDQNQDCHVCCNSSIDSEPLEDSNSALAVDTTNAAWGGSSTQENFEDENEEQAESLEEQDDEESFSAFDKGSSGGHRSTQYSGQFSNMQHYIDSVTNVSNKRQRNFQPPVYNRNQNQPIIQSRYQHPAQRVKTRQPISSSATPGLRRDVRENPACVSDSADHCSQQLPSKFIQQLRNQIDQLNALCQNQIFNDRAQVTANSHSSPCYSQLPNTNASLQPAPEIPLPYNQQLLLCLSQCCHALYMQQLEIHQLQRCIWHNIDGESSHQPYNLHNRNNHEDPCFRPYSVPPWSVPFNPSSHFLPEQISPLSSAGYFHLPMKPYPNHGGSYATGSATQPARAVIHPTSQNNTSSQETLNNQVPPRTRANNFWDNFRSYSRQNLLSTSNNAKRNENVASLVTPQVRQVYPLVTNGSPNRATDISNTCCNTSSFSEYDRPPPNPDDITTKNSKCNAPSFLAASSSVAVQKKDTATNNTCNSRNTRANRCHRMNLESSIVQPSMNSSNPNLVHSHPQDNPKGCFASIPPSSLSHSIPEASGINSASEISNMLSAEHKSDFLMGLVHEAQVLRAVALREKAELMRELAMNERPDDENAQTKVQNDPTHSHGELERGTVPVSNQRCSKLPVETVVPSPEVIDNEKILSQIPSDNVSGNIQSLPTAAIPPLSKHGTPRTVSTGAVRKKPKIISACFSEPVSNGLASSNDSSASAVDSVDPPHGVPLKTIDVPAFITIKVISDLISMLPSLKRRLLRDGCSQTFWTFINDCLIESLRTHLFFCNISLSRKSLIHLRQTVYLFLSLFSGMTLSYFDTDFLKYVEQFIFTNMTCFIATGQFAPVPSSLNEENCSLDLDGKIQEFVKMPVGMWERLKESVEPILEPTERVEPKMPAKVWERLLKEPIEPIEPIFEPIEPILECIERVEPKMPAKVWERLLKEPIEPIEPIYEPIEPFDPTIPVRVRKRHNEPKEPILECIERVEPIEHIEPIEPLSIKRPARIREEPVDPVVKMLAEETLNFSSQCGPIPEQNLYSFDNYIAERNVQSELESPEPESPEPEPKPKPMEDLRCDCNPEAEIEPEVEIGTEADLAEADQSPGQQGAVGDTVPVPENWSLDHETVLIHRNSGTVLLMNGDSVSERDIENSSECATGIQVCPDACLNQEAILDDIPTKLCASEEELPQQLKDEQLVPELPSDDAILHDFDSENNGDGGSTNLR